MGSDVARGSGQGLAPLRPPWVPVPASSGFGLANLPYGAFTYGDASEARLGVAIGDAVLEVGPLARALGLDCADALRAPTLNAFMALGPDAWHELRSALARCLTDEGFRTVVEPHLHARRDVVLHLPFEVADYVDFYASEHHAANVGRILRPAQPELPAAWRHLPIGYHGRSGSVAVSGTPVVRPAGLRRDGEAVTFGPTQRLDLEAEVGFVVGVPSVPGVPVPLAAWREHVFGVCLVNDWSARDIQAFEYVPLGPFLGKSFLTSVSPWVVPLAALDAAWTAPPARETPLAGYLEDAGRRDALALSLEVRVNGEVVSRPPFASMHWTAAQMLAHLTVNGACVRTGDLFASGTVSGADPGQVGSLLELGTGYLRDGDTVTIAASAPAADGSVLSLGEVTGTVVG